MVIELMCLLFAEVKGIHAVYPELRFQQLVRNAPPPTYPAEDQHRGVGGVVVLQASFDRHLLLEEVSVLQSPSPSLAEAAKKAILGWEFESPRDLADKATGITTKLTFYFCSSGGRYLAYYSSTSPTPACRDFHH